MLRHALTHRSYIVEPSSTRIGHNPHTAALLSGREGYLLAQFSARKLYLRVFEGQDVAFWSTATYMARRQT